MLNPNPRLFTPGGSTGLGMSERAFKFYTAFYNMSKVDKSYTVEECPSFLGINSANEANKIYKAWLKIILPVTKT